ncbi:MAG: DUF4124 domain-containing protein [Pseudomonadota bacterium]
MSNIIDYMQTRPPLGRWLLRLAVLALGSAALLAQAQSKIYKTVDAQGNVVYSDIAPTQQEGEAELQVEELNTYRTPVIEPESLPTVKLQPEEPPEEAFKPYTELALASPGEDQAVRANNGNISLVARINPALQGDHALRFYLDGAPVATVNGPQASLTAVDRGTHSARVAIVDGSGATIKESAAVTFHLLRFSAQNPAVRARRGN